MEWGPELKTIRTSFSFCRKWDIDRIGQNTFEANREIFAPSQYQQRTALYPLSRSESETLNCCLLRKKINQTHVKAI
ncbi:hypothetical protein YC2023_080895 [Brassica napus]